ncbi:MAG: hypothetical protein ABJM82_10570 [Shimia thalassica]
MADFTVTPHPALFEALNKYPVSAESFDTWFLDTPPSGGDLAGTDMAPM